MLIDFCALNCKLPMIATCFDIHFHFSTIRGSHFTKKLYVLGKVPNIIAQMVGYPSKADVNSGCRV